MGNEKKLEKGREKKVGGNKEIDWAGILWNRERDNEKERERHRERQCKKEREIETEREKKWSRDRGISSVALIFGFANDIPKYLQFLLFSWY